MNLLLEIGCEEIPALWIEPSLKQLKENAYSLFEKQGIIPNSSKTYGTPRRLVLLLKGIPKRQKDREIEIIGPPATSSPDGFAKAHSISIKELVIKERNGKKYYSIVKKKKKEETKHILGNILRELISSLSFPKSMRWKTNFTFARPIRWILCLLDNEIINFEIEGVSSSSKTFGLRTRKGAIYVPSVDSYISILRENSIIVDHNERGKFILNKLEEMAKKHQSKPYLNERLLSEIVFLVESPVIMECSFSKKFLRLPDDVLIASMIHHQRYVPLMKKTGLINYFLVVSNGGENAKNTIREGHKRVVSARLYDASFFFKEDLKTPLERFVDKQKGVIFQKRLGSLYDKTMRVVAFSTSIALRLVPENDIQYVSKAAFLSKADLGTQIVCEFPELQGIMGYYCALKQGYPKKIADALREHYSLVPKTTIGKIINLADRMDTLVGYFNLGIFPKGSEDPYGLRRCGNSIVEIILSSNFKNRLSLESLIRESLRIYKIEEERIFNELLLFFRQRLEFIFSRKYPQPCITAILNCGFDDIIDTHERLNAFSSFTKTSDFLDLKTYAKRVMNILREKEPAVVVDEVLFCEKEEKSLYDAVKLAEKELDDTISKREYTLGFTILSSLKKEVDKFFDNVMVMVDDEKIRENRISLLSFLKRLLFKLVDVSVI